MVWGGEMLLRFPLLGEPWWCCGLIVLVGVDWDDVSGWVYSTNREFTSKAEYFSSAPDDFITVLLSRSRLAANCFSCTVIWQKTCLPSAPELDVRLLHGSMM